jgi:endoribonuclease Dicer
MTFRDQMLTLIKFKRGDFNCLISTSVAEEGLDIPDCNIIIRFDLFNSVIQYIQSRGRARHRESKYIIMSEEGNAEQIRKLYQTKTDSRILKRFCAALPEDRKVASFDVYGSVLHGDVGHKQYIVPSSGAKLTFAQAMEILATFVASLPHKNDREPHATYMVTSHGEGFICEVSLPETAPFPSRLGLPQRNKNAARCSAAFETCVELIKKKYLDEHLRPVFVKKLPAMRNARLALTSNKQSVYNMRIKPDVWSRLGPPSKLFATALVLESPEAVGRASSPLLLLTRERLPNLPNFPLFFNTGKKSVVRAINLAGTIRLNDADIETLMSFTFRVFEDVFSKEYEAESSEVPYFLAPTVRNHAFKFSVQDPRNVIDWKYLESIRYVKSLKWDDSTPDEFYMDKFVVDPFSGSRKFFLRRVRRDMKPRDPVPDGVVDPDYRGWKQTEHNIKEYSNSAWAKTRGKMMLRDDQAVVEAELASLRRNLLDEFDVGDAKSSKICYVILEPLRVSAVSFLLILRTLRRSC